MRLNEAVNHLREKSLVYFPPVEKIVIINNKNTLIKDPRDTQGAITTF